MDTSSYVQTTSDCQSHIRQTSFVHCVSHVQSNILTYMASTHASLHQLSGSLNVCLHAWTANQGAHIRIPCDLHLVCLDHICPWSLAPPSVHAPQMSIGRLAMGPVPRVSMQNTIYIQANFCNFVVAQPALTSAQCPRPKTHGKPPPGDVFELSKCVSSPM